MEDMEYSLSYCKFLVNEGIENASINSFIQREILLTEGEEINVDKLKAINESLGETIKAGIDKVIAFFTAIVNKFILMVNDLVKNNKEYLDRYKELVLNQPPVPNVQYVFFDYPTGLKTLYATNLPSYNFDELSGGKIVSADENGITYASKGTLFLKYYPSLSKNIKSPDDVNIAELCTTAFRGGEQEKTYNSNDINITDVYNFCYEYDKTTAGINKDLNDVKKIVTDVQNKIKEYQNLINKKAEEIKNKQNQANNNKKDEADGKSGEGESQPESLTDAEKNAENKTGGSGNGSGTGSPTGPESASMIDSLDSNSFSILSEFKKVSTNPSVASQSSNNNTNNTRNTSDTSNVSNNVDKVTKGTDEEIDMEIKILEAGINVSKNFVDMCSEITNTKIAVLKNVYSDYMSIIKDKIQYYNKNSQKVNDKTKVAAPVASNQTGKSTVNQQAQQQQQGQEGQTQQGVTVQER